MTITRNFNEGIILDPLGEFVDFYSNYVSKDTQTKSIKKTQTKILTTLNMLNFYF